MISAGDHERMPKKSKDSKKEYGDEIDLTKDKDFKVAKIPDNVLKKLRKGLKNTTKFNMFNEKDDDKVKIHKTEGSKINSPIKSISKSGVETAKIDDMSEFVKMAKMGKIGVKIGNKNKSVK